MIIAITQHGRGVPYKFESLLSADEHPLIQYGDAFIDGHTDICKNYVLKGGLVDLKSVLKNMNARQSVQDLLAEPEDIKLHAEQIWEELS